MTNQTKFLFYISIELRDKVQNRAAQEGISVAGLIRKALVNYLGCELNMFDEVRPRNTERKSKKDSDARMILNYLAKNYPGVVEAILSTNKQEFDNAAISVDAERSAS